MGPMAFHQVPVLCSSCGLVSFALRCQEMCARTFIARRFHQRVVGLVGPVAILLIFIGVVLLDVDVDIAGAFAFSIGQGAWLVACRFKPSPFSILHVCLMRSVVIDAARSPRRCYNHLVKTRPMSEHILLWDSLASSTM